MVHHLSKLRASSALSSRKPVCMCLILSSRNASQACLMFPSFFPHWLLPVSGRPGYLPHLRSVLVHAAGDVVWRWSPGPAGAGAVTAHWTWGQTRLQLCQSGLCWMFGLLHLAILIHGMDANTLITCVVFEEGEDGGTSSVHSFPNICARPADDSLPDWSTTFAGTQTKGFKYIPASVVRRGHVIYAWAVLTLVTHDVYFLLKRQKIVVY